MELTYKGRHNLSQISGMVIPLQVLCQWDVIESSEHHKPLTLFFVAVLAAFLML